MKKIYVLVFLAGISASLFAEKLTGVVLDAFTREPLIGVSILNTDNGTGTVTDFDPFVETVTIRFEAFGGRRITKGLLSDATD